MSRFTLAFGLHNHQPVGNFDHVIEDAHRNAYGPFLQLLQRHPDVRLSLHQSGILWGWQQERHGDYFDGVRGLIGRGQIELMTGGYYEPILPAIPERDVLGQINMLNAYLQAQFGSTPVGLWLTERVWEPHLPKLLASAGVKYLPVDDTHFLFTGLEHSQLTGPFVTESEGYTVTLLPIQKRLRYLIPFGRIEEVIDELKRQAEANPDGLAVYADDGEKFGVWPHTHQHCYTDRWLERFFEALERNRDWLQMTPLGEAARRPAVGRVYLPTASYEEMLHWALPTKAYVEFEQFEEWLKAQQKHEQYGRFVRGGHWRSFLAKYEESNLMQKRMVRISGMIAAYEQAHPKQAAAVAPIKDRLYASQCNCPYWHGVFGGLYLPHIRQAVYEAMISAERQLRQLSGAGTLTITAQDYDADGMAEQIVTSDRFSAIFKPGRGGMLVDLATFDPPFALTDTLARRREGYHQKLAKAVTADHNAQTASIHDLVLAKEPGLDRLLAQDKYLRRSFIDHFFGEHDTPDSFSRVEYEELGDFTTGHYECTVEPKGGLIRLSRDGSVTQDGGRMPVRIAKQFAFANDSNAIEITYELTTHYPGGIDVLFALENNFNFQAGHAPDRYVALDGQRPAESFLDSLGSTSRGHCLAMADEWRNLAVAVHCDQPAELWHMPIYTVSLSEAGFEKVYQGTTLVHRFRLHLTDEPVRLQFRLAVGTVQAVMNQSFPKTAVGAR